MSKFVKEKLGQGLISVVSEFARADLPTVDQLKANEFAHVSDTQLQNTLAETFYGTRWLYKLGLALLVKGAEQKAHVRAQVVDYGAVCEGLLSDALHHALIKNLMTGTKYQFVGSGTTKKTNWKVSRPLAKLTEQTFHWHIEVAVDEQIIDNSLGDKLNAMRKERNTVHMRKRAQHAQAFINTSRSLFETTRLTIEQTKNWRASHP